MVQQGKTGRLDMQYGYAVWICSMDMQCGYAVWIYMYGALPSDAHEDLNVTPNRYLLNSSSYCHA